MGGSLGPSVVGPAIVDPSILGALMASTPEGTCSIDGDGDLSCTGQMKSLVSTGGGARRMETHTMQSPENWMEDFGSGLLERGVAVVKIDPGFAETVTADASYHVFITPNADSKGLYVIRKTTTSFEVRESGGGTSSLSFDYRVVAKRRGYEAQRLTDVTEPFHEATKAVERHASLRAGKSSPARSEEFIRVPQSPEKASRQTTTMPRMQDRVPLPQAHRARAQH
jgi:hypothetical protein